MSKTTYQQRIDKVSKFYDNAYHHHKATYKGFSQFFKAYCTLQKDYANQMLKLSEGVNSYIVDFATELPYIQQGIKEVCGNLERTSQLHFNYGERLREIGDYCRQEYTTCKKNKEKFMKINFEKSEEEHQRAKESKNRNILNEKEKQICKKLYNTIDLFMEDESNRTQKLKQQLVIYFSITKKIAQKQLQLSGAYSLKMAQFQIQVKVPQIYEVQEMLVDQFNSYSEQKIQKKMRDINQQISVHRESLRDSIIKRERGIKIEDYQSKIQSLIEKFSQIPEDLNYPNQEDMQVGLFDKTVVPNYRVYARQFKSDVVKELAYVWLCSYYYNSSDDQVKSFLMILKTNLKLKAIDVQSIKDAGHFIEVYSQRTEYRSTLLFLIQLSQLYFGNISLQDFNQIFTIRSQQIPKKLAKPLHWKIFLVLVDALLESLIIIRDGFSLLYDEYFDILKLIINFAQTTFQLDPTITVLLLLRKFQRALEITNSTDEEIIQQIFLNKLQSCQGLYPETEQLKLHIGHKIINFLTQRMTKFYSCKIAFSNLVKLSLCLQKYLPKNYFTALDHMHKCIKIAGYNFFVETDEDKKVIEGGIWRGEERLKNLTDILQQIEYEKLRENYFQPIAKDLAKLIGVGYEVILAKMLKEFLAPMCEIINCNLSILSEQEGVDRQGYVLRLGLCLAELDLQQKQDIAFYDSYFKVLETYLTATEKDYDNLLEHSRKTELWIVQENSQATQNCIDFCSMLYKPFEFLLTSLKKLQEGLVQTDFTRKYDNFIKLKLNNALKGQIQKYVKFLLESLNNFTSREPELSLKPKRNQEIIPANGDEQTKSRYSFREVTRRLYNIIFLKDQLDQLVCDFIDKPIYEQLDFSIFNLQQLQKVSSKETTHHDLLANIYQIATQISTTQTKLIEITAAITIYHFLKRLFANLYFQEEKGFFSANQYKLSEHTFQKYESDIQEILSMMSRNIPAEVIDSYSREVCKCFFRAFRFQVLNIHKFKINLSQETIINYQKGDLGFVCSLLKKKFFDAAFVREHIQEPGKMMFKDMEKSSQKLMESFSESSLKNNNDDSRYFLALLNIRRQEKAEEFVQKYKKMLK